MTEKPHYHGHRQRLKERFETSGLEGIQDYELLELLLFYVYPRADVKPLAKRLLKAFNNDFTALMAAEPHRLKEIEGVGQATVSFLKLLHGLCQISLKRSLFEKPIFHSWKSVLDYCATVMAHEPIEQFRVLYLDYKQGLISDELQQKGTINQTSVYIREVLKRALMLNAAGLILIHNHPSGNPTPSNADIELTHNFIKAATPINITIHDHIVIAKNGYASLKMLGHLEEI